MSTGSKWSELGARTMAANWHKQLDWLDNVIQTSSRKQAVSITKAIQTTQKPPGSDRLHLDTGGNTKNLTSSSLEDRVVKYATIRQQTVGRIMVLGERLREVGAFDRFGAAGEVRITAAGAFWQAFQGTRDWPACHTSPALLLFNGFLPNVLPQWAHIPGQAAIQRRIVEVFAHCILMPQPVNRIDQALDERFGQEALIGSMEMVRDGASAREATWEYQRKMLQIYDPLANLSPAELVRVLGRLEKPDAAGLKAFLASADTPQAEEEALIAQIDDPNREIIRTYEAINKIEVSMPDMRIYDERVTSEMGMTGGWSSASGASGEGQSSGSGGESGAS